MRLFTHASRCTRLLLLTLVLLASSVACSSNPTAPTSSPPFSQTDLVVGTGAQASAGSHVTVSYTGWLYDATRANGKGNQFDSSPSYSFMLGVGTVIAGWDQGVVGMRVGGQRRLVIPPNLAYGSTGAGTTISPNATLVFEITLLSIR